MIIRKAFIVVGFQLIATALSAQTLPPAPQGPYQSIEDLRAENVPIEQPAPVQEALPFPAMEYPSPAVSPWGWGTPAYPQERQPGFINQGGRR